MSAARLVVTVAVVVALVGAVVALSAGGRTPPPDIVPGVPGVDASVMKTARGCETCHPDVYREWRRSWHSRAMTDELFLEQLRKTATGDENPACLPCHIPQPIHETGLGMRPQTRKGQERRDDGIDCITCHKRGAGVAASRPGLEGACNPIHVEDPGGLKNCAGCHNQHWTVDEWEASVYAQEGTRQTCVDCHMPVVERPGAEPSRPGRSHVMHGGRHLPELKKAVIFGITLDGRKVVVATENSGAGHKIPTDSRHRSFNVLIWFYDRSGNVVAGPEEIAEYRLYYRSDLREDESTQILPKETARVSAALPADLKTGRVVARLYYCFTPFVAGKLRLDPERSAALLVAEATVEIE